MNNIKDKKWPLKHCFCCGRVGNSANVCRFKDLTCHKCRKIGHIAKACKSVNYTAVGRNKTCRTNAIDEEEDEDEDLGLFNVDMVSSNSPPIRVALHLNNRKVVMMIDTGAAVTLIPEKVAKRIPNMKLEKTDTKLTTYIGEKIKVCGKCSVVVKYNDQEYQLPLFVPFRAGLA